MTARCTQGATPDRGNGISVGQERDTALALYKLALPDVQEVQRERTGWEGWSSSLHPVHCCVSWEPASPLFPA